MGAHAELTWFIPGDGSLRQSADWDRDVAPDTLAVQGGVHWGDVVFSVADGKVVKPSLPQDAKPGRAVVYPNGFGYEYTSGTEGSGRVALFDNSGKEMSRPELTGTFRVGSADVPMVETEMADVVLTLDGRRLLEIPKPQLMPYARLIGTTLFITSDERHRSWRQYDLRTGASGKTCDTENLGFGYLGSDGAVAVIADGSSARAIDLATCDSLWALPHETQTTAIEVWKVNTSLIQRTNEELFSLVAPS
ncbi:hypothetical protein [Mycobacterium kyorinense]|uniref:hypothetical protein n=1 Tax=Mycobacterium kyorinense TaxID=487514 RepID=UPI000A8C4F67|nr:hypothetical protein [Mycobacterium kyorinense]